ncbi:MAG: DUF3786 domain-containing protein [Lachnospiraceae bacterium]|nr:DUF3786 domain-containing protein [Lachnospiraceae bacterium]
MWNRKDQLLQPSLEQKKEQQNRQMDLMLSSVIERLQKHSPSEIAEKSGVVYDEEKQILTMDSLGMQLIISLPDYTINQELEMWHHLTVLQYLETADGTPMAPLEQVISLTDLSGGLARGVGFNKDIETMFAQWFSDVSPEQFASACEKLGGTLVKGRGDVSAVLWYAPRYPVTVNFWCADDEFKAQGKTLLNRESEHYLTIEAAGGVCSTVVQAIRDACRSI